MTANTAPRVSVIMANYNGAPFILDALASASRQTIADIEILVVDDGSTDDSVALIEQAISDDPRIVLLRTEGNSGPAAARNIALDAARGSWVAVLDSDDIMHPARLERLIDLALSTRADIVADNQIVFDHSRRMPSYALLAKRQIPSGFVATDQYVRSNSFFSGGVPLGYLKPVFHRALVDSAGCRYEPALRIAEDYDFVLRLLLSGARFLVSSELTYFYRRHKHSVSHRLSAATLQSMLTADDRLRIIRGKETEVPVIKVALNRRCGTIRRALAFEQLIESVKARRWFHAIRLCAQRPDVAVLLAVPIRDRLRRGLHSSSSAQAPAPDRRAILLSRQRIVGAANGSSAYLLSLCACLRRDGYTIDLISPSPAMFGRWPVLRLDPAMDLFATIKIRGGIRVGRIVIACNPSIALHAAAGLLDALLCRGGIRITGLGRKAPHAIAVPLTDADRLYIARVAKAATLVVTDYAFLNETIPFTLQPRVRSAVVMHDLFSEQDAERSVVRLDRQAEADLLAQADVVVAIQSDEAEKVRRLIPGKPVILAPMAINPAPECQPGRDNSLLFVGSNTLPNLDGIQWFIKEVWPAVVRTYPQATLQIAGSCCSSLPDAPNVTLLGRVDDLDTAYRDAGIVVSPLRLGSGLKIKLVEALGHGKAIIASETTLQGVGALVEGAVLQANTTDEFIAAITRLLLDRNARRLLGDAALRVAREHFSADVCYRGLLDFARIPAGLPTASEQRPAVLQSA